MNAKKNEIVNYVFDKVNDILEKEFAVGFRSLARSFPSIIQKNGLNVAIIYLYSSSKGDNNEYKLYLNIIQDRCFPKMDKNKFNLLSNLVEKNSNDYRILTNEIMDLSLWIKRFAEGMIFKNE